MGGAATPDHEAVTIPKSVLTQLVNFVVESVEPATRVEFARGFRERLSAYEAARSAETNEEMFRYVRAWVASARLLVDCEFRRLDDEADELRDVGPGLGVGDLRTHMS